MQNATELANLLNGAMWDLVEDFTAQITFLDEKISSACAARDEYNDMGWTSSADSMRTVVSNLLIQRDTLARVVNEIKERQALANKLAEVK